MKYKKWMAQFKKESSIRGHFAKLIRSDRAFPSTKCYGEMYDYLRSLRANDHFMEVFEETFQEYEKYLKNDLIKSNNQ